MLTLKEETEDSKALLFSCILSAFPWGGEGRRNQSFHNQNKWEKIKVEKQLRRTKPSSYWHLTSMLLVLTNLSKKIHYLHIYIQRIDKALHNSFVHTWPHSSPTRHYYLSIAFTLTICKRIIHYYKFTQKILPVHDCLSDVPISLN